MVTSHSSSDISWTFSATPSTSLARPSLPVPWLASLSLAANYEQTTIDKETTGVWGMGGVARDGSFSSVLPGTDDPKSPSSQKAALATTKVLPHNPFLLPFQP